MGAQEKTVRYTFDVFGWFDGQTDEENPQRATDIAPPDFVPPMRPNWTGGEWVLLDYEAWQEAQHRPAPPRAPESVTMRQARLALLAADALASVNAAVAAAGEAARIEWEFAQEVRRDWPLVNQLTAALGWTSEQVDALFIAAENL